MLQATTVIRCLEEGSSTLAEFIDRAIILCDQCNDPEEARELLLLQDAIVIGLQSRGVLQVH